MNRFKTLVLVFLGLFVLASVASAQDQPAQFIQTITVTVRPGASLDFEDYIKKLMAGAKKIGAPQRFFGSQVTSGGPPNTYIFSSPFNKWEELDDWVQTQAILSKAYGDVEGTRIFRAGRATIEHFETTAYRLLSNLSTRPKVFDPPPAYTLIIRTEIDPAMASEYERYLAKIKSVQEPASNSPTAIRRVSVRGDAATYVTAQPFNKNAELDSWPALNDLLTKAYGEAEARSILEAGLRCVRKRDVFTLMYRPDLSQPTAGSASK